MGNKPWEDDESAELRKCVELKLNDVESSLVISAMHGIRRTPSSCYFRAIALGLVSHLSNYWTTRPHNHGRRPPVSAELDPEMLKDEAMRDNDKFITAMAREGRTPQEPSRDPGTASPKTISPRREGRPSSAAGWVV